MSSLKQSLLTKPSLAKWAFNLWPPLLGTGISVKHIAANFQNISVELKLRFYNKNYIGIHYGGNLFTMTDPFYTLMLFANLGKKYFICDRKADIEFLSPGKNTVAATFILTEQQLIDIKANTSDGRPYICHLSTNILDPSSDKVIAKVHREIFIQEKNHNLSAR